MFTRTSSGKMTKRIRAQDVPDNSEDQEDVPPVKRRKRRSSQKGIEQTAAQKALSSPEDGTQKSSSSQTYGIQNDIFTHHKCVNVNLEMDTSAEVDVTGIESSENPVEEKIIPKLVGYDVSSAESSSDAHSNKRFGVGCTQSRGNEQDLQSNTTDEPADSDVHLSKENKNGSKSSVHKTNKSSGTKSLETKSGKQGSSNRENAQVLKGPHKESNAKNARESRRLLRNKLSQDNKDTDITNEANDDRTGESKRVTRRSLRTRKCQT